MKTYIYRLPIECYNIFNNSKITEVVYNDKYYNTTFSAWVRNEGYYILRDTQGYINGVITLARADDTNAWKYEDELVPESIFKATQWIFDNSKEK